MISRLILKMTRAKLMTKRRIIAQSERIRLLLLNGVHRPNALVQLPGEGDLIAIGTKKILRMITIDRESRQVAENHLDGDLHHAVVLEAGLFPTVVNLSHLPLQRVWLR